MTAFRYYRSITFSCLLFSFSSIYAASDGIAALAEQKCLTCHGAAGLAGNPLRPNIDGLQESYLVSQLLAFQDGTRQHAPETTKLSNKNITALAVFFANRPVQTKQSAKPAPLIGFSKFNTCIGCHGVNGEGRGRYPRLAGLSPAYISKQLQDYQQQRRKHETMTPIAQTLNKLDIEELATHIGSL